MRSALRLMWMLMAASLVVSACGSTDLGRSNTAQSGAPVPTSAASTGSTLDAGARQDAWAATVACAWVRPLAPESVERVKFTPIGDGKSVSGTMVSLFYSKTIVVPAGTPMLSAAGEAESGKGSRTITGSSRDETVAAVMIAVVDGVCTFATPIPEPIAAHERSGSEPVDSYR